ncbi:MAG: aldo/keto reductase [Oscillospiraceae bacterium]
MEYRINPKNQNKISLLGMGCMRLPYIGDDNANIDYPVAQAIVDAAYAHGVNYFDTAYPYHSGKSEAFIGKALAKYPRQSYFLADKMPVWKPEKESDLQVIFDEQLARCGTEYFDYYLCHAIDAERFDKLQALHLFEFLQEKKAQGKIHNIGFSFHDSPEVLERICSAYPWDFVQIQLNYLDWEVQKSKEQYEIIKNHNFPCIIMEPVRGGALANLCPEANEILLSAMPQNSVASWAIRFAASLGNVITVLSGMSAPIQIEDNLATMSPFVSLCEDERKVLAKALTSYKKAKTVPCTGCRYCMPCPMGVDIPGIFAKYNKAGLANNDKAFATDMAEMSPDCAPTACISCGKCAEVCPQHIDIPQKMQQFSHLCK